MSWPLGGDKILMGEGQRLRDMVDAVSVNDCSGALLLKGTGRGAVIAGVHYGEERTCFYEAAGLEAASCTDEVVLQR